MTTKSYKLLLALGLSTTAIALTGCPTDPVPTDTGGSDVPSPEDTGGTDGGGGGDRCTVYCTQLMTNCTGANAQYDDMAECLAYCGSAGWPAGAVDDVMGNTLECRIYHGGAPAAGTPAEHCPHAGPSGGGVCGAAITFRNEAAAMFDSVDRMGMPAVATALVPSAARNDYNDGTPTLDAELAFASAALGTLGAIHMGLDDDLTAAGVTPCSMAMTRDLPIGPGGANVPVPLCAAQFVAPGVPVAALVIPDTLRINPAADAGFPNGRELADPVIDVTLSIILLDIESPSGCGGSGCTPTTLVGTNPMANDETFLTEFPYLAAAHTP